MAVRSSSRTRTSNPEIPVRRLDFGLDADRIPRDYYGNDLHLTAMWNALSVLFPEGETFFVDSVRQFRDRIDDPRLAAEIVAFVGQEAMHSKEHDLLTKIMQKQGSDVAVAADKRVGQLLALVRKILSPKSQLAATAALEHFTALLAEQLLTNPRYQAMLDENARGLWCWHALEESEHKSVAFDVYETVDGSYVRRAGIMALATVVFFAFAGAVYVAMLKERGKLSDLRGLGRYVSHFWLRGGFFSSLAPAYFEYYKPGFHPEDRDHRALTAEWDEKLFGENGLLRAQLRQVRKPTQAVANAA